MDEEKLKQELYKLMPHLESGATVAELMKALKSEMQFLRGLHEQMGRLACYFPGKSPQQNLADYILDTSERRVIAFSQVASALTKAMLFIFALPKKFPKVPELLGRGLGPSFLTEEREGIAYMISSATVDPKLQKEVRDAITSHRKFSKQDQVQMPVEMHIIAAVLENLCGMNAGEVLEHVKNITGAQQS